MCEVINTNNKLANLNTVQEKAFSLIQADARFLYSFVEIHKTARPKSNFNLMSLPYLGLFIDGAEKWGNKVGVDISKFTEDEKNYYEVMRNSIKLFDLSFVEYSDLLHTAFEENDKHFYDTSPYELKNLKLYHNVGTDVTGEKFCGNTILCSIYIPCPYFSDGINKFLRDLFIVGGELTAQYGGANLGAYSTNPQIKFTYKDFHFFDRCPLKNSEFSSFVLFSVLCSINYILLCINKYFIDEFPAKLRFAYILYYYLANFIQDANDKMSTTFNIDKKYLNQDFRNCMVHYGLGQVMKEADIIESDSMMFGLTDKFFSKSYFELKECIYFELQNLADQLETYLLK